MSYSTLKDGRPNKFKRVCLVSLSPVIILPEYTLGPSWHLGLLKGFVLGFAFLRGLLTSCFRLGSCLANKESSIIQGIHESNSIFQLAHSVLD